ncbi:hypothetical protein C0991_009485 [Blastosporella zonata]|nr:hypothetical protein C0991_009485 [Blastosporella zonata]
MLLVRINRPCSMELPPPGYNQAFCDVSVLESGIVELPLKLVITTPSIDVLLVPSLSFLIQHTQKHEKLVFDLGIRKDWQNLPPTSYTIDGKTKFSFEIPQDVVQSLAIGGLSPSDIDVVCLSHCHFDHIGDTKLFPTSKFVVGAGSASLFDPGYPADPTSGFASDLLPADRTTFLSPDGWTHLGPFSRALDLHGDGSVYVVDAPGHCPGHINLLVRTSADGGWVYLAGDSGHHWSLVTGENAIATEHGCVHADKGATEKHLAQIRGLLKYPRVRVLLAHDEPWYNDNKGGDAFWPGKLPSL